LKSDHQLALNHRKAKWFLECFKKLNSWYMQQSPYDPEKDEAGKENGWIKS